jgi:hypothetical protein
MADLLRRPEQIGAFAAASRKIAEERFDVHKVSAELLRHAGL